MRHVWCHTQDSVKSSSVGNAQRRSILFAFRLFRSSIRSLSCCCVAHRSLQSKSRFSRFRLSALFVVVLRSSKQRSVTVSLSSLVNINKYQQLRDAICLYYSSITLDCCFVRVFVLTEKLFIFVLHSFKRRHLEKNKSRTLSSSFVSRQRLYLLPRVK